MKRLFSTDNRTARILCNSLLALVAVWVVASILGLSITCGPATKLAQHRCDGQVSPFSTLALTQKNEHAT